MQCSEETKQSSTITKSHFHFHRSIEYQYSRCAKLQNFESKENKIAEFLKEEFKD